MIETIVDLITKRKVKLVVTLKSSSKKNLEDFKVYLEKDNASIPWEPGIAMSTTDKYGIAELIAHVDTNIKYRIVIFDKFYQHKNSQNGIIFSDKKSRKITIEID